MLIIYLYYDSEYPVLFLFQIVPLKDMIGRVSMVTDSLTVAAMPLGLLLDGTAASWAGTRSVMLAEGVTMIFIAAFWLFAKSLRTLPTVEQLGSRKRIQ